MYFSIFLDGIQARGQNGALDFSWDEWEREGEEKEGLRVGEEERVEREKREEIERRGGGGGERRQDYEKGLTGLGEWISRNNPNTRKNIGSVHKRAAEQDAASALVGAWKCNFYRKL